MEEEYIKTLKGITTLLAVSLIPVFLIYILASNLDNPSSKFIEKIYWVIPVIIILSIVFYIAILQKYSLLTQEAQSIICGKRKIIHLGFDLFRIEGGYKGRSVIIKFRWAGIGVKHFVVIGMKPHKSFSRRMIDLGYLYPTEDSSLISGYVQVRYDNYEEILERQNFVQTLDKLSKICIKIETGEISTA